MLRNTKMPSILLENLFIDTTADAAKLKDPVFRANLAGIIAEGLIKALDLKPQDQNQPPDQPPHWAAGDFTRIQKAGLANSAHNLDSPVTWGEMSAVLARLLDKLKL